jgi:HSP20 family protein
MSTLARRDYRGPFAEMVDWLESPWALLHPVTANPMRVEDYVKDGSYVVRAEIPGVDPEKDIEVSVAKGILTITAERHEESTGKHRSEFRYGVFRRSVTLPAGADDEHVEAVYSHGILQVTVKVSAEGEDKSGRKIPVRQDRHIRPT